MPEQQSLDMWAIVEVMGHKKYAGHVTEHALGPAVLLRVDVPETEQPQRHGYIDGQGYSTIAPRKTESYSKLIGAASIYQITPCTEDVARRAAVVIEASNDPIPVALPPARQLAAGTASDGSDEADVDIGEDDEDEGDLEEEFESAAGTVDEVRS